MSSETDRKLPSFRNPPLHEVALSVQFESVAELTTAHVGKFWRDLRDRFPVVQEQPALSAPAIERDATRIDNQELVIGPVPPRARLWLLDAERRELVQVQHDRFIRNWRKTGGDDRYPRYDEHIRPRFEADYQAFCDFVRSEGFGEIQSSQCEVSYFNRIPVAAPVWRSFGDMHKVFCLHSPIDVGPLPITGESVQWRQTFAISQESEFKGRLYTEVTPAVVNGEHVIRYDLTARGHPRSGSIADTMAFLDLGRQLIVEYFARSTSSDMHEVWERE